VLQDWLKWYEHIRVFSFQVSNFWSVLPLLVRGVANHGQMYKCVCMCFVSRQGKNPRVMQFHVRTKCMINEKRRYRRKRSFGSFDFWSCPHGTFGCQQQLYVCKHLRSLPYQVLPSKNFTVLPLRNHTGNHATTITRTANFANSINQPSTFSERG
jgi:hypothetical protein